MSERMVPIQGRESTVRYGQLSELISYHQRKSRRCPLIAVGGKPNLSRNRTAN